MRLVLVEWIDSLGCSQTWQEIKEIDPKLPICRSVGWLLHDSEECKVLIPHLIDSGYDDIPPQACGDMAIPACSIRSIVDLPVPETSQLKREITKKG